MIKPMLAAKCPPRMTMEEYLSKIRFPVLATPKIDGIRCITLERNGEVKALTRKLKPVRNIFTRYRIQNECPAYLDGELTCGENFQAVTSGIMSILGQPDFTFYVFGCNIHNPDLPYTSIVESLTVTQSFPSFCKPLIPVLCADLHALLKYESECIDLGAEGVMIRRPDAWYKYGRSTINDQCLMAIKRFEDEEGTIIGFNEQLENVNEAEEDALGYTKRSASIIGKIPKNTLGSLRVRNEAGIELNVGTGFTDKLRLQIWLNRSAYLGKRITYKFQRHGTKIAPRQPVFKWFRED